MSGSGRDLKNSLNVDASSWIPILSGISNSLSFSLSLNNSTAAPEPLRRNTPSTPSPGGEMMNGVGRGCDMI